MSLLADLRAAAPAEGESGWAVVKRTLPFLVPGLEITKLEHHSDGRMAMRGKSPMQGRGRYYMILVMDGAGAGRADGTREVKLGVASYRDEADAALYDDERVFRGWVNPQPGAVAAWLVGVLMTRTPYDGGHMTTP